MPLDRESSLFGDGHETPSSNAGSVTPVVDVQSVDQLPIISSGKREKMVSLNIGPEDTELLRIIKSKGAYWDSRRGSWRLSKRAAIELGLESYLV